MQQRLKSASGAARAQVVASELLGQLNIAVDAVAAPDLVSNGKGFRRLRVMLKAGEVVELLMLAHGEPASGRAAPVDRRGMLIKRFRTSQAASRNVKRRAGWVELSSYQRWPLTHALRRGDSDFVVFCFARQVGLSPVEN
jgi:hypothetical protein